MFWQQHPEKQNKEVEWTAQRYALNRAKQQTGLKSWPKLPHSQGCSCCRQWVGKWWQRCDSPILLWLLAFQRANMFLPSLQHSTGRKLSRAQNWWESVPKLASGCFRIAQDCCGAAAYFQTFFSFFFFFVIEWRSELAPPSQKWGRKKQNHQNTATEKRKNVTWWQREKKEKSTVWGSGCKKGRKTKSSNKGRKHEP